MKKYAMSIEDVLKEFNVTRKSGLNDLQVEKNLTEYGPNKLVEKGKKSIFRMILKELLQFLNMLLIAAAIISIVASGHLTDGLFIIAIVILNISLSVFQERKATNAVSALKSLSAPGAKVLRNGEVEMKKLVMVCKELFNLDLGNIYKTYGEIKAREKDPTKFLDLLKMRLLQKMQSEH